LRLPAGQTRMAPRRQPGWLRYPPRWTACRPGSPRSPGWDSS